MKKNYLLGVSFVALFLLFNSCSQEEEQIIPESTKTTIEPDFFEADGSMDETEFEEEAPTDLNTKTYSYYNYTLLKPSELSQEKADTMCGDSKTMPLLVGSRKKKVGEVEVRNDDENLYLTFTADEYKYMKKVYLYIGEKGNIPFYSNGFPNLRKFNFKAFPYYFGGMKKATYTIPLSSIDADCFEIVAYSKVYDKQSRCFYSSFGYDESATQTYGYSYYSGCYYYNEWVRSFEYCKESCEKVEEYEDAYAYKILNQNHSTCFLDSGFEQWGWTNRFVHNNLRDFQIDYNTNYSFPLYIDADECEISNGIEVGYIEVFVYTELVGRVNKPFADVKYVITNNNYQFKEANLFIGDETYPRNDDGNFTVAPYEYNYSQKDITSNEFVFTKVNWTGSKSTDVFIIPQAKVLPIEN